MTAPAPDPLQSEAFAQEVARRLVQVLADNGTPAHQQAKLLTHLCGLSPSQARRKLQGAHWSIAEVLAVAQHCQVSLDALFPEVGVSPVQTPDLIGETPTTTWLDVRVQLGSFLGTGEARLGLRQTQTPANGSLVAQQGADGWWVGTPHDLGAPLEVSPIFAVDELLIHTSPSKLRHIAILDDDKNLADSLAEWLTESGFRTCVHTSASSLLNTDLTAVDGFIVDYLLNGQPALDTLQAIRRIKPHAPVLLLTGKLRDNQVSESELMAVLRAHSVTFFEKPVRPGVLAAALLNGLDRQPLAAT